MNQYVEMSWKSLRHYDLQPVFSPSVLAEMIRPDGSSTISVVSGESLSAELAHEMMNIQVTALENKTL